MIKIQLIPEAIANNIMDEEGLSELSCMESIYAIRKLRAAILLAGKTIEVGPPNKYGQVFLVEFDISIDEGEYRKVKSIHKSI